MKLLKTLAVAALGAGFVLPAQAQEFTGTLGKIAESGQIVIGHRESSVPFSYLDENQKPIGYSIDLCMKVVDAVEATLGKEVEIRYVPVNPKTRIALMANGTIDLECGSTTNNLTRQEQVEYLPTTFITGTKLLVRKDSGIGSGAGFAAAFSIWILVAEAGAGLVLMHMKGTPRTMQDDTDYPDLWRAVTGYLAALTGVKGQ